jgi:hypothetical protein
MTLLGFLKDFIWGGDRMAEGAKLYVWEWADGGWNSGFATSLEEAKKLAKWMGTPTSKGGMTVTLVPVNVRLSTTHGLGSMARKTGSRYRQEYTILIDGHDSGKRVLATSAVEAVQRYVARARPESAAYKVSAVLDIHDDEPTYTAIVR